MCLHIPRSPPTDDSGMATPAAPSGPPALQRIPTARISPRTSAPPPRHGPAVAVILETMQGGGTPPPPLPRVNNHTWLSEHLYPVVAAASTSAPTSATPQGGPTHPAGPSWSPFDLDTQPVDTFPIHPSASMSNQPGGVGAGGGTCGVGTPETLDIEDTIGEGGFGVVYKGKVRGPEGEVQVAIKTLKMQVGVRGVVGGGACLCMGHTQHHVPKHHVVSNIPTHMKTHPHHAWKLNTGPHIPPHLIYHSLNNTHHLEQHTSS